MGALSVMSDRLEARSSEAKKITIEAEVVGKGKDAVQQEVDTVQADSRTAANTAMNAAAALASHIESSARRKRAFDAEVRRAQDCAQHATSLRDMHSRGELVGEDRKGFENAELLANQGAEAASKRLTMTVKRAEDSARADKLKQQELKHQSDEAASRSK